MSIDKDALLRAARAARAQAYAPYSDFFVGAALLGDNGKIYCGCNVENASFGATLCAERCAVGAAVADGVRNLLAIAIVGGRAGEERSCMPCGICRQVLSEFSSPDTPIYLTDGETVTEYSVAALLPHAFSLEDEK